MSEPTPPVEPKKRKKRVATPRGPRVIDPGIAAIHAETKRKVAEYRSKAASAKLLTTIIDKRLAQLTPDDRNKLADALSGMTTPGLFNGIPTAPEPTNFDQP